MNTLLFCCKKCCENLAGSDEKIALIICETILLLVVLIILGSLIWYVVKHVIDPILRYIGKAILGVFSCRTRKGRKDSDGTTTNKCGKVNTENDRLYFLKKEYQLKALRYIEERKKEGLDVSVEEDTFLKNINRFVSDIDKYLESTSKSIDKTENSLNHEQTK